MRDIVFYVGAEDLLGRVTDASNTKSLSSPVMVRAVETRLRMRIFANSVDLTPYPISAFDNITAWRWAMDSDFDAATSCILESDAANITVATVSEIVDGETRQYTEVSIPISNMNTQELAEWLGTSESKSGLNAELIGYDAGGNAVFLLQVKDFTVRSRITSTGTPSEIDPEYLTATQVRALIASGAVLQYSVDGSTNWHDTQVGADRYLRFRSASSASAAWTSAIKLPEGEKGDDGDSAYATVTSQGGTSTIVCGVVGGTSTTATVTDGVDSSATVVKSGTVATITCTTGTVSTTATISDGTNGTDSSATVVKSGTVATITCTTGTVSTTATISDGRNGTDASAIVVKSGTVATITCTTGETTTTATVLDGARGFDASATVVKSGTVATITCTTGETTTTATVSDGKDGAIITKARLVYITVGDGIATLEDSYTGDTEDVDIVGGTSIAIPSSFLDLSGLCEFDLVAPDGYNISKKADRGWLSQDDYTFILPGGWVKGIYYACPCGIRGEDGTVQVRAGTGTTVSQSGGTARVSVDFTEVQKKIVEGANISIGADGKTISATDTTYAAGSGLSLNGTQFSIDTSALVFGGTASLASDHTALLGKQEKLTSANAGDNVTIAEVGGVMKISSNGTTYTSSDSIEFTGGTSPTANLRISDSANSPLSIEGGTAQGLKLNLTDYFYVDNGKLYIQVLASAQGDSIAQTLWSDFEFCAEVMHEMRDNVLSDPNQYFYTAGDNVTINGSTISAIAYTSSDSIEFVGGTSSTANVKIYEEAPLYIIENFGLDVRVQEGLKKEFNEGQPYIGINWDSFTLEVDDDGKLSAPTFGSTDSIIGGTVSLDVAPWTRYTGTCDLLAITSIENSPQESEIVVTFAGTAANPDVGLPVGTQYVGTLPTYMAGKTYLMNFRSGIVRAEEVLRVLPPQLAYLESTGTQYIDTGIVPTNATKIEMEFAEAFSDFGNSPFGVFDNTAGKSYGLLTTGVGGWSLWYGAHYLDAIENPGVVTKIEIKNGEVYFNDIQKKTSDGTFTCGGSLLLYAERRVNSGGVPQFFSSCKISSCKIWLDGETLSRDYVPLLWSAGIPYIDGNSGLSVTPASPKPGWYDRITGKLFVNQGSNEFLY